MARLDYRMAMKLFQVIIARYRGLYAGRAKSRLREIGRLARQKMALYEQLWGQGREEEAIRVLAEVAEKFDGSETATTAKSKLVQFAQTPGLAEMVSKARAEAAASFRERLRRRLLRAAESDVPEQEAVAAEQDTLEVREPSAQEKCNRLLSLAANYRLNRHLEAARAAYKEIIDLYPEDESAEKAEEELRAVEKEMEEAEY
ncbi:MAG: tetratricopeptide repeat protein [Planctomycetes bacterium]|nr:tetratricopeptide repeat protein [Planctomycetota bacterium]